MIVKSYVTKKKKTGHEYRMVACQLRGDPYFSARNVSQVQAYGHHVCIDAPLGLEATNQTEIQFCSPC